MKRSALILGALTLAAALMPAAATGPPVRDLGTVGTTYPVAEPDALEEILEAARKVDWSKVFDRSKWAERLRSFKPPQLPELPRAARDRVRPVDLTWTLPFDIPRVNSKGEVVGVLYPKGYAFNPLEYVTYTKTLVFVDGDDPLQLRWLKASGYARDPNAVILLTGGCYWEVSRGLQRPVFYALRPIVERLKIEAVPSVARQRGNVMEVREIDVEAFFDRRASGSAASDSTSR